MENQSNHLPWLDWIRFLAAFTVLASHARGVAFVAYGDLESSSQGPVAFLAFLATRIEGEAVIVFFVLSGFLVGGRGAERLLNGTFRLKDYAIDRVSRIVTPLVPSLLLSAAIAPFINQDTSGWGFLGNLLV